MVDQAHELTAAYALDALGPEERLTYEAHLASCRDCQEELASFWEVSRALSIAAAGPEPAADLRERILAGARADRQNVVPLRPRRWVVPAVSGVAAVAAVLALALGLQNISLSNQLDESRSVAAVLGDPDARTIALEGANGRLVVGDSGRAVLVTRGLPPPPEGKAYEIWVIEDGRPDPAGLFSEENVVALERGVSSGNAVAVTLEDEGGAAQPTGMPLFTAAV